ncbi:E3 ubiquitin-protein ligase PUB23 [Aegilops tauschii subsp. strangulata]|uniref:U-box domain-containing protein n=1 Tax=Aegilops tauschii subsp. strangulata TaxID=200361 RepID=A0A453CX63_AEGTS|nr:E3 ubiquitin-protein ligase PUB23 [Aegilops tauschii subsp. strangulata]
MAMEESPQLFLCPISMELMEDPVTVSTGVTYDRRSIERWFFKYGKTTCPATMQRVASLDLTPNHTLKRVIASWQDRASTSSSGPSSPADALKPMARERLPSVLAGIEGTPFKVTALKGLRLCMAGDQVARDDFVACDGIQVLGRVMAQALAESGAGGEFSAFRTCEEAAAVLATLPLSDEESVDLVLRPECMRPMVALVQRGSAEARLHAMSILAKVSEASGARNWTDDVDVDDMVKSLLDLLSDGASSKLSSRALDVLIDVTARSRSRGARRGKGVVEVGAVRVLVELLPEADRHVAERALLLLKRLCKCPEGRLAFAEHGLAVAAVVRTVLRVSGLATRLAVNVLWLVSCAARPTERVLDDMVASGGVAKLLALLQADSSPSTKEKVARMLRVHGAFWRQYPCIPADLKDYLKFLK